MGNLFSPATSVDAAKYHFELWVLPRCIRDVYAEMLYFHKFGVNQRIYRRVLLDEEDRGTLYPIWTTGIRLLAHFGIGVGIYFAQLLILSAVFFIGGIILSPAINTWQERDWLGANSTAYLATTAALPEPVRVQASEGCASSNDSGTCDALFRSNTISKTAIACDLAMVLFVFVAIYVSKFYENKLKEDFDEAVQSAQDYAVYVADPSPSATDPDEWYKFFSRFGKVKYITVTKKNGKLKDLLKEKHLIVRSMCAIVGDTDNFYQKYYGGYTNLTLGDDANDDDADFEEAERRKQIMQLFDVEENKEDDNKKRRDNMKRIYKRVQKYRNAGTSFSDSESDDDDEDEFNYEDGKDANNNQIISNKTTSKNSSNYYNNNNNTIGNSNSNSSGTVGGGGSAISSSSDALKSIDHATTASIKARNLEFMNLEKLKKKINKEKMMKLENELTAINNKLSFAFKDEYEANQVYAIFDYEEHQRLALSELEVADIETADSANASSKLLFRGENVLKVAEPPEPDNVLWSNNEITTNERRFRNFLSRSITIAMFVGCFYLVRHYQIKNDNPTLLAIIVGVIDAALPTIFLYLSNWEAQRNEGMRQESLQIKLFGTRLLLSTIFPYLNVPWNRVLDASNMQQNFSVQIAACFTAPIIQLIDVATLAKRYLIGPIMSTEQKELNIVWSGVQWTLAEKYTNISKILFISLFYALLAPSTLFIAAGAFALLFLIDRYLLLRRWEQPLLIDDAVAKRLRQQALIAVTAHAFVSLRFLYSWPMDSAYFNEVKGIYIKVNKEPLWNVFSYTEQVWQNEAQKTLIPVYKIVTYFLIVFTLYVLFGEGIIYSIRKYFSKVANYVGEAQGIPFSSLSRVPVYVPQVMIGTDKFMFADIRRCDKKHHPVLKKLPGSELPDLSVYVPRGCKGCLSVVKWYSDDYDDIMMSKPNKGVGGVGIGGVGNATSEYVASASGLSKGRKSIREKLVYRPDDDDDVDDIELGSKLNKNKRIEATTTIGDGRSGRQQLHNRDSMVNLPGSNSAGRATTMFGDDDDDNHMHVDPNVKRLRRYLHNFRTLQAQSRPPKKAPDSTTYSSNSNSNSNSNTRLSSSSSSVIGGNSKYMETTRDILTSLRSLTRKIGEKPRQVEDEEIKGKLRTSITEYFRKFLETSSIAAYNKSNNKSNTRGKSMKIAPMDPSIGLSVDSTSRQYTERHHDSILDLRSSDNSHTIKAKPVLSSSNSSQLVGSTSPSATAKEIDTAEINFDLAFNLAFDDDDDDDNNNNHHNDKDAIGRFGDEQRSYKSIKKVMHFNESLALTIPQFLEKDDLSLLREINLELLDHDDFDPISIFDDSFEDFVSFGGFYDRLILLSPYAICVPEYTPPHSSSSSTTHSSNSSNSANSVHTNNKVKETPQEMIKKMELKLKLRQIFSQIIFIQKELLLNKSDVKSIIGESDLKVVEKALEGAVSWKIFMSILLNIAVISH